MSTPQQSRVVLFGSSSDPDVRRSINKVAITGRKVELSVRPSFDTGTGPCGKYLCSCKNGCEKSRD